MVNTHPSIQSFYQREVRLDKAKVASSSLPQKGDGFTEEELANTLDPLSRKWDPQREYVESNISQLAPGPGAVTFIGRIVNLRTVFGRDAKQPKASGYHYLIVKDDSAAISIKLYFAQRAYPVQLGQLLSLWTVFISDSSKAEGGAVSDVGVCANLFPGRVTSDHVVLHTTASTDDLCRVPLGWKGSGRVLAGLMTLESFLKGGHDGVDGAKILVCVKSLGAVRGVEKKAGGHCKLMDLWVFDHTGEVKMTVWNEVINGVRSWKAGETVLLISSPGWRVAWTGKGGSVGVTRETMVDVKPVFEDAEWLRKYAVGLWKKDSVAVRFPEGVFDFEGATKGVVRMLFTLAELDIWVRTDGHEVFTGFISITIIDMSLVSLYRRNMLMCAECCGVPIYANALQTPCRNCSTDLNLTLNPRVLGTLVDETGCIAPGKLIWSERAWEEFFGRKVEEVVGMTLEEVRMFEMRVLGLRGHLCIGWNGGGRADSEKEKGSGRLCVLGFRM